MSGRRDMLAVKTLLVVLAILLAAIAAFDPLADALWIGAAAIVGLLALVFVGLAIVGLSVTATGQAETRDKAVQIALILAIVGASLPAAAGAKSAGRWAFGRLHLERNLSDFEAQAAADGDERPVAFSYLEGIPDGGVSIVRSAVDPERLPHRAVSVLLNGNFVGCRRLRQRYWLCGFD